MEKYLSTGKVCLLLGISLSTFYRYIKAGLVKPAFFTPGGHRRVSFLELLKTFNLNNTNKNKIVCYSRVSSIGQKEDLLRQTDKLLKYAHQLPEYDNYLNNIVSISDIGSGLNYKKIDFCVLVLKLFFTYVNFFKLKLLLLNNITIFLLKKLFLTMSLNL